jgi:hypothetical protein
MISGIFAANFGSNSNRFGTGVAVFSNNLIHGGDSAYYYRGKYKLDDGNRISGTIDARKYSNLIESVFGPGMDSFRLNLNGFIVNDNGYELQGRVEGRPDLVISIILNKLDELIEA